jgi:pyruvate kinase
MRDIAELPSKAHAPGEAGREELPGDIAAPSLVELHTAVLAVRADVAAAGEATMALWRGAIVDESFLPGAENLAHYLALRRHDLSALQPGLAAYGLSSLGRSEARVMTALDALSATLARLAEAGKPDYPPALLVSDGERELRVQQDLILGRDPDGEQTRIMVTLPTEAGADKELIRRYMVAGANCVRINCAHDDPKIWAAMIRRVRALEKELKRDCRVLMDIAGPKCRIEAVRAPDEARLHRGDRFALVKDLEDARASEISATISFPEILALLRPGAEVWINDGKIGARVVAAHADSVKLETFSVQAKGAKLKPEKGVNFPGTALSLPSLTKDDLIALDFVAEHADLVGFSFVQRPSDITLLDRELARRRPGLPPQPVVLKIETRLGVENLPQLIVQGAGARPLAVMIARGDLAVELGFGRMSEIQEEILWVCDAAHVPVIWATQVLDSFVSEGAPTRAEATDAAMSQRAECVMLNKGPYLDEAVGFLRDVLRRMDRHQSKKTARLGPLNSWRDLAIHP